MKINLNTLSPLNAVSDSKSGTAAAVSNMMNYYVDSGNAVPFNISKRPLPVTPVDPLTEIAEWHFSEVDMVKIGKAYYEIDKTDNSVMPVGVNLGKITLSDNGSGGFLSTGGEELMAAEHLATADGIKDISTVERSVGSVESCCSSDGTVILYGGSNGAYSVTRGASWNTLGYNFIYLAMMGAAGSIIWGSTSSGLYYSLTNGSSWVLKLSVAATSLKMINPSTLQYAVGTMYYTITQSGSPVAIDEGFSKETRDITDMYFNTSGVLMHNGSVYLQSHSIQQLSDEPWYASSYAYMKNYIWYYADGSLVPILDAGASINYICVYKGIIVYSTGNVYKNGVYLKRITRQMAAVRCAVFSDYLYVEFGIPTPGGAYTINLSTAEEITVTTGRILGSNPASPVIYTCKSGSGCYRYDGVTQVSISPGGWYGSITVNSNGDMFSHDSTSANSIMYVLWRNQTSPSVFFTSPTVLAQYEDMKYDGNDIWRPSLYYRGCNTTRVASVGANNVPIGFVDEMTFFPSYCCIRKKSGASYAVLGSKVFISDSRGFGTYEEGRYHLISASLSNSSLTSSIDYIYIGGFDGIYKSDSSGIVSFVGATLASCKMGGNFPFIGTNNGAIYLLGIATEVGQRFWNVKVTRATTGYNIQTLATNTTPLVPGTYMSISGITGNPTPLIDASSFKQMILFKTNDNVVWVKRVKKHLQKFFQKTVFTGIDSMITYLPDHVTQYGSRLSMAGGYEVSTTDNIINGNFDTSLVSWIISNAAWGAAYGYSGGGALITNGYIRQNLAVKSFCIALVKGSVGDMAQYYQVVPFSGSWFLVILGFQSAVNIYTTGSMYVDSVHAYNISPMNTTVSISDIANYEEFYRGSGSQQKVPSSDNVINGIIPIGKSLYVIKDNSTGKIDETGDVSNPFYVTEEMVLDGGSFPVRFGNSFIVVRKRPSLGDSTIGAEVYLFNGQNYERLNTTWNNEWSTDSPFVFGRLHVGSVGGLIIIGNSAQYGAIISDDVKIGAAGFLLPGTIDGDITEGAYNQISSERNIVAYTHNADPDAVKRLKGVGVLPEQDVVVRVWRSESPTIYTSSSAVGSCGFNLSGTDFFIKVDADEKIGQIIINEDTIMPRLSK